MQGFVNGTKSLLVCIRWNLGYLVVGCWLIARTCKCHGCGGWANAKVERRKKTSAREEVEQIADELTWLYRKLGSFPDPWVDPKSRSTPELYSLYHSFRNPESFPRVPSVPERMAYLEVQGNYNQAMTVLVCL